MSDKLETASVMRKRCIALLSGMDALEVGAVFKRIDYNDDSGETVWYGLEMNVRHIGC